MAAAAAACRRGFGRAPAFVRSGGTIPIVAALHHGLGMPVVLLGLALPDDHQHAPDERLHLPTFWRGVATATAFLPEAAERLAA
jgi:acetylornithine deacetylase/succinyl-diaminopimelate desuccinylase-like protein